jgi:hypothetical protein
MLLIGFAGSLELNRSPCLDEATGEESMSDDPDFPKANHALQVLRQACLSRNEAAAIMSYALMLMVVLLKIAGRAWRGELYGNGAIA